MISTTIMTLLGVPWIFFPLKQIKGIFKFFHLKPMGKSEG